MILNKLILIANNNLPQLAELKFITKNWNHNLPDCYYIYSSSKFQALVVGTKFRNYCDVFINAKNATVSDYQVHNNKNLHSKIQYNFPL